MEGGHANSLRLQTALLEVTGNPSVSLHAQLKQIFEELYFIWTNDSTIIIKKTSYFVFSDPNQIPKDSPITSKLASGTFCQVESSCILEEMQSV